MIHLRQRLASTKRPLLVLCFVAVVFLANNSTTYAQQAAANDKLPSAAICRLGEVADSNWSHGVYATTFSPNGKLAAIRSSDQIIRIWDIESGRKVHELPDGEDGRIKDFVFSHDSQHLATAVDSDAPDVVALWSVATGKPVKSESLPESYLVRRGLKPGELVYVGQHSIALLSVTDPLSPPSRAFANLGAKSEPLAISADQSKLIIGRAINQTFPSSRSGVDAATHKYLLDVISLDGKESVSLQPFEKQVTRCAWAPNGNDLVVACREEKKIYFRDLSKPTVKIAKGGHAAAIQDLEFSPDGRQLVSVAVDGKLRIWDVMTKSLIAEIDEGVDRRLVSADFSPNGRYLATGSAGKTDNSAIVWDWNKLLLTNIAASKTESPWDSIGSRDPRVAYPAIKQLVESPAATTRLLYKKFGAGDGNLSREEIDRLIERLNHPSYSVRATAHEALSRVRVTAASQLRAVLESGTAPFETEVRLQKLLTSAGESGEFSKDQTLQLLRGVHVLELIGDREAATILQSVAKGHPFDVIRAAANTSVTRLEARLGSAKAS